jgi:Tol biopolymer transport system component
MKKDLLLCLVLTSAIVVATVLTGCGDSTITPIKTSQLAFIRETSTTQGVQKAHIVTMSRAARRVQLAAREQEKKAARVAASDTCDLIQPGTYIVHTINVDGTGNTALSDPTSVYSVQLSLDGTMGAFSALACDGYMQIFVVNMSNPTNATQLTTDAFDHYEPQLSPDKSTVIWSKWGFWDELWTTKVSDKSSTRISTTGSTAGVDAWSPTYTPDGAKIVFTGWRDGDYDWRIYIMNSDGSGIAPLTANSTVDWYPSVSPDGSTVAFEREAGDSSYNIYTVPITGETAQSAAKQLTTDGDSGDPLYVGSKIAFVSWRDTPTDTNGDADVWTMNYDGTNQTQLATDSATDVHNDYFSGEWW